MNNDYFIPILEDKAEVFEVEGVEYFTVRKATNDTNTDNAIIPVHRGKIKSFKIGEHFYIPVKIVPIVYREAFKL